MFVELQCIVVTPERTVHEAPAEFVALPLYDGEIGIAPGHSPMIGRLGWGEMRIAHEGQTNRFYVEGGFVEVSGQTVSVLTSRAVPADQLNELAAKEQLHTALEQPAHTPEEMDARQRLADQARAQLRVIRRAKEL
ncbi:MAG TPA: ATP synthase F1 subunit epsilon [Planctomycetaceae bacterium]|nr:ATP synthase F1 subunit epsilon [Planctomycetaceae bacterium]HIQ22642.1 ATP synthase F1 subunit epsilon [Planctomycetota bacterium]